jgi:hypothetical protein
MELYLWFGVVHLAETFVQLFEVEFASCKCVHAGILRLPVRVLPNFGLQRGKL